MSYGVAGFAEFGISPATSVARQAHRNGTTGGRPAITGEVRTASDEYAWEKAYERPWEAIEEDAVTGALITRGRGRRGTRCVACALEMRAVGVLAVPCDLSETVTAAALSPCSAIVTPSVQRGMLRHMFLVLDMSRGMEAADLKPSRAAATVACAKEFVREFFDQNPISSLGVIVTRDATAAKASELSGNPRRHVEGIDTACRATSGDMSLQASLELAARTLMLLPDYGTREVVIVHGALATCDAGNIDETIASLVAARVRVSVVSLPAEVYVASRIARMTGGDYVVPETPDALRAALILQCRPPARRVVDGEACAQLMEMGFPKLVVESAGICACHAALRPRGYACPRCDARSCELPTICPVCALQLVSAPGLARSYHHLFPVPPFRELVDVEQSRGGDGSEVAVASSACAGCGFALPPSFEQRTFSCPNCDATFCDDCDVVIHETLHVCPSCTSAATRGSAYTVAQ